MQKEPFTLTVELDNHKLALALSLDDEQTTEPKAQRKQKRQSPCGEEKKKNNRKDPSPERKQRGGKEKQASRSMQIISLEQSFGFAKQETGNKVGRRSNGSGTIVKLVGTSCCFPYASPAISQPPPFPFVLELFALSLVRLGSMMPGFSDCAATSIMLAELSPLCPKLMPKTLCAGFSGLDPTSCGRSHETVMHRLTSRTVVLSAGAKWALRAPLRSSSSLTISSRL